MLDTDRCYAGGDRRLLGREHRHGISAGALATDLRGWVEAQIADCTACADLTWAAADVAASASHAPGNEGRPFVGQLTPG